MQAPPRLIALNQALSSEIFCGGASWNSSGELVVVGGLTTTPYPDAWYPVETYRFNPLNLGPLIFSQGTGYPHATYSPASPPWEQLGNLASPRYYPTVIPLNAVTPLYSANVTSTCAALSASSVMVLGGPPSRHSGGALYDSNEFWELLPPQATAWSCPIVPPAGNPDIPPSHSPLYHPTPTTTIPLDRYSLLPTGNPPKFLLDSYPRAFQVSNNSIFVPGDVDTATVPTTQGNLPKPGNSWVMKPRTAQTPNQAEWQFFRGPEPGAGGANPPTDPTMDRYYGTAVLLQRLPASGGLDRVLVFGGLTDAAYYTGGGVPNPQVLSSVQEVLPLPPSGVGEPFVNGLFQNKTPMLYPRYWMNAVILPTGQVFLNGGAMTPTGTSAPALDPELYDPGLARTSSGSTAQMKRSNIPAGATAATPRLYHSLAMLLPDGRVFVAGGEGTAAPYANAQFSGELYSPPYLFKGFRPIVRPIPSQSTFGTIVGLRATILLAHNINADGVVLVRPGSLTHHFDTDQRYIELNLTSSQVSSNATTRTLDLQVTMPDLHLGPPGYYMLFVIETDPATGDRVPSLGQFIQLQ